MIAAASFARSLNILLKYVRLYGLSHRLVDGQLKTAWQELRTALPSQGETGILLGVSDTKLLLDGVPLDSGGAEKTFAQLLSAAGIASIHFSPRVEQSDLAQLMSAFAVAGNKPSAVAAELKSALGEGNAIRVNQVKFVATDESATEAPVATILTAQALGGASESLQNILNDPKKLLQVIAAAQGESASTTSSGHEPGHGGDSVACESDLFTVFRMLSGFARTAATAPASVAEQHIAELPEASRTNLEQALLAVVSASAPDKPKAAMLIELAEHMAIRFALQRFERGEVRINAVREMFDRMAGEMETLRKILASHEDAMNRAGMVVESHADILDRQFWAAMPDSAKRSVLLTQDAWCIPPRNVAQYVRHLMDKGQMQNAGAVLHNYAACMRAHDPEARRKAAIGVIEMAELYARVPGKLVEHALQSITIQLAKEHEPELQKQLSATFIRLAQEAGSRRHLTGVRQALSSIEDLAITQPDLADTMRPRLGVEMRLRDIIEDAVRMARVPEPLIDILKRTPQAAMGQLISRFERCVQRAECERIVEIAGGIGEDALKHLRELMREPVPSEAARAVGLLSRLDPVTAEQVLADTVGDWTRAYQDVAVRQIAAGGSPKRGQLLLAIFERLDPLVLPEAVDEIGATGEPDALPLLAELACGERGANATPYLRLKALEALGRLSSGDAVEPLLKLLQQKHMFRWAQPRELRIAAFQALTNIEPQCAREIQPHSGLRAEDLQVAPLPPETDCAWTRQRRYPRVIPDRTLTATASTSRRSSGLTIESLSLGGGLASTDNALPTVSDAFVQLRAGLRPIRAQVLVREAGRKQVSFEFVDMDLPDHSRLRTLLANLRPTMTAVPLPAAPAPVLMRGQSA